MGKRKLPQLKTLDWIRWCVATAVAAVTMSVTIMGWAYSTFPTKDVFQLIIDRLERIENKIDQVTFLRK